MEGLVWELEILMQNVTSGIFDTELDIFKYVIYFSVWMTVNANLVLQ